MSIVEIHSTSAKALTASDYDKLWLELSDFIRFNPGAMHRRRKILKLARKIPSFHSVLDVGCGLGEMLLSLTKEFPNVKDLTGVDLSSQTIAANSKKFPNLHFDSLNIEERALPKTFDLIVCSEVIEHLENRPKAYQNLTQMLAPGGHLILTCPSGKVFGTERYFGHVSHPTVKEIRTFAQSHGLEILHLENWGWPNYRLLKIITNLDSHFAIKQFGSGRYSVFKKLICFLLFFFNFLNISSESQGCQIFALLKKSNKN